MNASKKYKIGITFNLESEISDIWANGANQNVIHLYNLFKHSSLVENVVLVSWGAARRTTPPEGFLLDGLDIDFAYIDDVIDELDVLIEGMLVIEPHQIERMRAHGGKTVCYKMGNDMIMDAENMLFNRPTSRTFNGTAFDAVWTFPHHENTCRSYFHTMYRCPVYIVPFIWSPVFCDKVIGWLKRDHNLDFGYCPNPTKTAKRNIMSVEARYQMPDFLTRYVDVVLSHQWENGLNYAYNDALYGGYPFIHNSKLIPKGVGYYYDQFDAEEGAKVLLEVIENHDKRHDEYVKRANEYLDSQLPTNPLNICYYEQELLRLFK